MTARHLIVRNAEVSKTLSLAAAEVFRISEQWREDKAQSDALAGAAVVHRVLEAVRDAVRLRPSDNEVSRITVTTIDAAALGLEQASDAAKDQNLKSLLRDEAEKLRKMTRAVAP